MSDDCGASPGHRRYLRPLSRILHVVHCVHNASAGKSARYFAARSYERRFPRGNAGTPYSFPSLISLDDGLSSEVPFPGTASFESPEISKVSSRLTKGCAFRLSGCRDVSNPQHSWLLIPTHRSVSIDMTCDTVLVSEEGRTVCWVGFQLLQRSTCHRGDATGVGVHGSHRTSTGIAEKTHSCLLARQGVQP